ncbi:hypothetical protein Glove_23g71 [Diversispora epigaea]|uniref:Uncharacterized protein n=1 Tax=Diversispora epigaea TaxID=1348612 RepID=A0A397JLC3_9GLOM|nr:hypothetical protein Glove_23g71 [Diversispora epigaea]
MIFMINSQPDSNSYSISTQLDSITSYSIPSETTTTGSFSCKECKIDSSVNTSVTGEHFTSTEPDPPQSESGSIYTTFSLTTTEPTTITAGPITGPTTGPTTTTISRTSKTVYSTTTFYTTTTIIYPGYTTTYWVTTNGRATPTEKYIPPSTVIIVKKVTAEAVVAIVGDATATATSTSNAGDSINNIWKDKLNRMIVCLWAIGVAFVYTILV